MKDKEKQIEERTCWNCNHYYACEEMARTYGSSWKTYLLYNKDIAKNCEQYQPKLPKDSVVLSREEYERLLDNAIRVDMEYLDHELVKASKETAEKFYKKVKKLLKKVDIIVDGDEGLVGYEESAVDKGLTELAKQFGVEIKE